MNELFVNGQRCDLSDFTRISLTKQANNLGELQNRNGDFTNTFKLPLTPLNVTIFGVPNDVQSNSIIPYRALTVDYFEDGVCLVANGRGVIEAVSDAIELSVTSGNVSLSDAIGDLTVGELYDDTFDWTLTNVLDGSQWWVYPLINWRIDDDAYFDTADVDVNFMLPCLYVSDMFERLGTRLGFDFQGSFINSVDFETMVLTPSDFERTATLQVNSGTWDNDGFADIQFLNFTGTSSGQTTLVVNPKIDTFTTSEFVQGVTPQFNPTTSQVGKLRYRTTVNTFRFGDTVGVDKYLFLKAFIVNHTDSVVLSYFQTETYTTAIETGEPGTFIIDFATDEMTFVSGKSYRIYFSVTVENDFQDSSVRVSIPITDFILEQSKAILFKSPISFRDLFRMKVKDVFKDVLNLRCLMLQTDVYSNVVKIDYFDEINNRTPLDWTDKLDVSSQVIGFDFGKYSQRNWIRFKDNTNVQNQLGDAYFTVDNHNLEAEKDAVKFSHPATEQQAKFNGINIPRIKAINSALDWQKPDYRILQVVKQDLDFTIDYTDGTTTIAVDEQVPLARFVSGQELIDNYYSAIKGILDQSKVVRLPFKLTATDTENIDFLTPIYIEGYGTFYLNKIENNRICELIRL